MHIAAQPSSLGATVRGDLVDFHLWAPRLESVTLRLHRGNAAPQDFPVLPLGGGYWSVTLPASSLTEDQRMAVIEYLKSL